MRQLTLPAGGLLLLLALGACKTTPYDYSAYLDHLPRSILVLPPLNNSPEVLAPYSYLSTVSLPIAEQGYYIFPVAVVDAFLKENGMPTPGEMHQIPLDKVRSIFDADAVLYVVIHDWGTEYQIINSQTTVSATGRLVDVDTGTVIWTATTAVRESSSSGSGSIIAMLINALISQVVSTTFDYAHDLSHRANHGMVYNDHHGFLRGPRNPRQEEDLIRRREDQQKLLEGEK